MTQTPDSNSAKTRSTSSTSPAQPPKSEPKPAAPSKDGVQGEANYTAAREFNEADRQFVAAGKVSAAARAAAPTTKAQRQAMLAAEKDGKRRAKE